MDKELDLFAAGTKSEMPQNFTVIKGGGEYKLKKMRQV